MGRSNLDLVWEIGWFEGIDGMDAGVGVGVVVMIKPVVTQIFYWVGWNLEGGISAFSPPSLQSPAATGCHWPPSGVAIPAPVAPHK